MDNVIYPYHIHLILYIRVFLVDSVTKEWLSYELLEKKKAKKKDECARM